MADLAIILGVFLAAFGLRGFAQPSLRRLGVLLYLSGCYLVGWLLLGSHWAGAVVVAAWFLLPWVEILVRIRKLTLPMDRTLRHRHAPPRDEFPQLPEITEEVSSTGFEQADDTGWDWQDMRQFVRFFYHSQEKTQAAIHLNQQGRAGVIFVSLTTRSHDGRLWTTWNYPFPYTMKMAPGFRLHRVQGAESFEHLLEAHRQFVASEGVEPGMLVAADPESLPQMVEAELRRQVDHNLDEGILKPAGQGLFRYSLRGCFFLWRQFIKDMVRLS